MGKSGWNKRPTLSCRPEETQQPRRILPQSKKLVAGAIGALLLSTLFVMITRSRLPTRTRVLLDKTTVPTARYDSMETVADQVALSIDQLIPGQVGSYPHTGIFCFVAPSAWNNEPWHPPPITLVGPKQAGEPKDAQPSTVRIALNNLVLSSKYTGEPELVFELAHELAHAKMDARYDNYLVEMFAVAVSLRTLKDFRYDQYRNDTLAKYINELPQTVRYSIDRHDWNAVASYWQDQTGKQKSNQYGSWSVPFGMSGSLVLEDARQPVWRHLLGIAALSEDCVQSDGQPIRVSDPTMLFRVCRPEVSRMIKLRPALKALGYPQP